MVILIVGGSNVPALVQSQGVLLVAGVVTAGADGAFAVTDLNQMDALVSLCAPVAEVDEVAEGGTGMVELGDGLAGVVAGQQFVVQLQACIGGLVVDVGVVTGDDTLGVEGIHVAGAAGPGHLEAS